MTSQLADISSKITPVLKKYGVKRAGVFGSYARGDARPDSDIDLLVTFGEKPLSLWDVAGLQDELEEHLGHPVDVVSDNAVVPYFRDSIYNDLQTVYEG